MSLGPEMISAGPQHKAVPQALGWASIFAAATITVALTLCFHLFGIGLGLTTVDAGDASSLRRVGLGTGIWTIAAPIVALFFGGLVAGRTAPTLSRWVAAIHGAATWAFTSIAAFALLGLAFGAVANAPATASAVATSLAADAHAGAGGRSSLAALEFDREELVARLNTLLRSRALPLVTRENVDAIVREATRRALFEGGIERDTIIDIAAKHTALSRQQTEIVARDIEARMAQPDSRADNGVRTAGPSADDAGKVMLGLSIAMFVGLFAAMLGAAVAVRRPLRS